MYISFPVKPLAVIIYYKQTLHFHSLREYLFRDDLLLGGEGEEG